METIISVFMSIITFFASLFGVVQKEPVLPASTDNFVPVVRFFACSDTHISDNGDRTDRIEKLFEVAYEYAENDPVYNKLDAAMFVGDCTNNGTDAQFKAFGDAVNSGKKDGTQILAVAADHHDGWIGPVCLEKISEITGLDSDFHVVINGFHFIGISSSKNEYDSYAPYQRTWLKEQLEAAKEDDPNKPIFVCNHEHVYDTVYGSGLIDTWGTIYFKDILRQYPQVVHFSGHSHYPLNDPRSVIQDRFTAVGTGAMYYAEFRYKSDIKIRPADSGRCVQAWIVEADAENNVRLTGIDVISGGVLCQYVVPAVFSAEERVFTEENMKLLSSAPEFQKNAVLTAVNNGDGTYTITAPAAESTDGKIILAYIIRVYDSLGILTHTEHIMNSYYCTEPYEEISFTVKAKPGYRAEVTAENAYYMASEPVSVELS